MKSDFCDNPSHHSHYEVLARQISKFAKNDGKNITEISDLYFYRHSKISQPLACLYELGLAVGIQGRKKVVVGDETFENGPGLSLLTAIALPVVSHISEATTSRPYLGILLTLDIKLIAQLSEDLKPSYVTQNDVLRGLCNQPVDEGLRDALVRLVLLLNESEPVRAQLAPLIKREVYVRLLVSNHGPKLLELVAAGSPSQQISKTIDWLKKNFRKNFQMDLLASKANMSPSTFRQHFRQICGMSPLQFQKRLRLQDARRILLTQQRNSGEVAFVVGYESVSQFTREYRRLFGNSPLRDRKLQQQNLTMVSSNFGGELLESIPDT